MQLDMVAIIREVAIIVDILILISDKHFKNVLASFFLFFFSGLKRKNKYLKKKKLRNKLYVCMFNYN